MEWECYACGRRYKRQPDYCRCGSLQFKMMDDDRNVSKKKKR